MPTDARCASRNAEAAPRRDAGETFTEIAHDLDLRSSRVQQISRREEERAREVAERGRWMNLCSLVWLVQELRRAMDDADWGRVHRVLTALGEDADMQIGEYDGP